MAGKREAVFAELSKLLGSGGALERAPQEVVEHFDELRIVEIAEEYSELQMNVSCDGLAFLCTAGPPGAGKSSAIGSLELADYRRIDPDIANDLVLKSAENAGLLDYRRGFVLSDGNSVGIRELSTQIHSVSSRVTDVVRAKSLHNGENIVLEGTLVWAPLGELYVRELLRSNYESLTVVDVELPLSLALERAKQRWWQDRSSDESMGGRFVPDQVIKSCFTDENVQKSICAENARKLANLAGQELGQGKLLTFEVSEAEGRPLRVGEMEYGR